MSATKHGSHAFVATNVTTSHTVGERLRTVRIARGYSIEDVAKRTGVRRGYIMALEEGRLSDLPALVYSTGFVKKYAHLLYLPIVDLVEAFRQEYVIYEQLRMTEQATQTHRSGELPAESARRARSMRQWVRIATVACVTLLLAGYVVLQAIWLSAPPTLIVVDPSSDARVSGTSYTVVGTVEEGSALVLNGEPVRVSGDGAFRVEVPLRTGENRLEFQATNAAGKVTTLERSLFVDATVAPSTDTP